ncbi:helix-turn-helix transcriptional regulator [Pseudofrankia sp. BMG5.36]|uniref:helix-turn-helix domain-containing protein n=1 Tax=Pseudofrankia sp. BMG5.36 TaxID=1834512 RepID=UPI0008DB03BE|nr:helix-turn-helix transcriptional regulator [Pseudofrankia sp. BMG5.36]OHV61334.1 hypothetical protein BCD48_39955 [Pseudofrankia sp. BMG5.36]
MRELRTARGLSLRALAGHALSSKSQLHAFETGRERPTVETARHIDDALEAGGTLLALAATTGRGEGRPGTAGLEFTASWPRATELAVDLWRRDASRQTGIRRSGFDAAAFTTPVLRWLTASFDHRPVGDGDRPVETSDVEVLRRSAEMFRDLDNQFGGGGVRERIVRFLDAEVAPLLLRGRFDGLVGAALLSAVAELSRLAGWTSYDVGLHGLGQRYLIQALRLALAAGDVPLGAEIIAAMSHQAAYLGAVDVAVDLARAAGKAAADAGFAALRAEAAVLEAHSLALRGDEQACTDALDRAEHELDRADRARDPQWIGYFDEAYLSAKFGQCFASLGRGDLAARFATRSLEMDGRFVRGRQFNLALLARAFTQTGEIEQAATIAAEAMSVAEGLRSARVEDRLRYLSDQLRPHAEFAAVGDFVDRFDVRSGARLG